MRKTDASATPQAGAAAVRLNSEERMLVTIRDTLYEGSWEDFVKDLRERLAGRPHVFETVPASARMKETIGRHISLIEQLARWEREAGTVLRGDVTD